MGATSAGPAKASASDPTATSSKGKESEAGASIKRKSTSDLRDKAKDKKSKGPAIIPHTESKRKKKTKKNREPALGDLHAASSQLPLGGKNSNAIVQSSPSAARSKWGTSLVGSPEAEGVPPLLQTGEIILLGDEELAKEVRVAIPANEKDVGEICKGGFPRNDPDGFVAHIPKFGMVQKGEGSISDRAQYAREMFRANMHMNNDKFGC